MVNAAGTARTSHRLPSIGSQPTFFRWRVACPVLVMHGRLDELIPLHHGEALFAAARGPKRSLWLDGAGHADVPVTGGDTYDEAIHEFLKLLD